MNVLVGISILSDNTAQIGKGLCAGKGLAIKQDWCWSIHVQGHDLHFSFADLQSYLLIKLHETVCLLLYVLMRVRQQHRVVGEVKVLQHIKEFPSDPSWLVVCCVSHHPVYHQVKKDCRTHTSLMYACLDLEVQAAASHFTRHLEHQHDFFPQLRRLQEGIWQSLACRPVAGPQKLQHRRRTGSSHSGPRCKLQQCSSLEQSARGVLQDFSRCPSGMLALTHPVELVLEKIMQETLHDHHTSIFICWRQPLICWWHWSCGRQQWWT